MTLSTACKPKRPPKTIQLAVKQFYAAKMSFVSKSKTKFAPKIKKRLQTNTKVSPSPLSESAEDDKSASSGQTGEAHPRSQVEKAVFDDAATGNGPALSQTSNSETASSAMSTMNNRRDSSTRNASPLLTISSNRNPPSKRRLSSISSHPSRRGSVKLEEKTVKLKSGTDSIEPELPEGTGIDPSRKLKKKKRKKASASIILSVPKYRDSSNDENSSNSSRSNSSASASTASVVAAATAAADGSPGNVPTSASSVTRNEVLDLAGREFDEAYNANRIWESIPSLIHRKRRFEKRKKIQQEMGLDEADKKFLSTADEDLDVDDEFDFNNICLVLDPETKQVRALKRIYYETFRRRFPNSEFKITSYSQLPRHGSSLDEQLFKNFTLDENTFIMSDLCAPSLPIGDVSQDYRLAKEGTKKLRLARLHQSKMRREARKLGIPLDDLINTGESLEEIRRKKEKVEELLLSHSEETSIATSTLQLNLHGGAIVVDQQSQLIDTRQNLNFSGRERTIENENPYENPIHSRSFSKYSYSDRWTLEETVRLYHALGTWGTDFGIISGLFPHRTRRQIKKKFSLEEKKRLPLIEMALNKKLPPNLESYIDGYNSKKDNSEKVRFKTIDEFNEELKAEREKHEKEVEIIKQEMQKSKKHDRETLDKKKEDTADSNEEVIGEIPVRNG